MRRSFVFCFLLSAAVLVGCKPTGVIRDAYGNQSSTITINTNTTSAPSITNQNSNTQAMPEIAYTKDTRAIITTNLGKITVAFYEESPKTVSNFLQLAKQGFYDGTKFHRVIKDFMIQGGDPNSKTDNRASWGTGGPGYKFADEFNDHPLVLGSLAMANSGPNTNGSQFFIVTAQATPWLDGKHTNFGYVVEGQAVVDAIESSATNSQDQPRSDVVIQSIEVTE